MGQRRQAGAAPRSGLGNVANLRTPPGEMGEIVSGFEATEEQARKRRLYALQRQSSWLLKDMTRAGRLKPGEEERRQVPYRVASCLWSTAWSKDGAGVRISKTTKGSTWRGLQICGSIWHCPVCAARISNERRKDIKAAVGAAAEQGYKAVLMTLTARHDAKTDLREQLQAITKGYEAMWRGAPAKRIKKRYGILGIIRSLEATHSRRNGWHPHIHAILFVRVDADVEGLRADLSARWQHCASRHGLSMNEHGFDLIDDTQRVADYVAKYGHEPRWQSADELARWHTKIGRARGQWEHFTPWQLLEFSSRGDALAGDLFREYARVFHGRHQIVWSNGLRDVLGLARELTDQEAAEKEEEAPAILDVYIAPEQWARVRKWIEVNQETGEVLGNRDRRCEALELVDRDNDPERIKRDFWDGFGFVPIVVLAGQERPEWVDTDESEEPNGLEEPGRG